MSFGRVARIEGAARHLGEPDLAVGAGDGEGAVLEHDVVGRRLHDVRGDLLAACSISRSAAVTIAEPAELAEREPNVPMPS